MIQPLQLVKLYLRKRNPFVCESFSINNVHKSLGFVNSRRFLRKNQLFYTSLSGIIFLTWCQVEGKNSCLRHENYQRQSPTFNLVDLGIPAVCSYDFMYVFQIESTLFSCLKVKEHLA